MEGWLYKQTRVYTFVVIWAAYLIKHIILGSKFMPIKVLVCR